MSSGSSISPRVLSVVGDSLTAAGVWPALVADQLDLDLVSTARAGQTSTELALRRGALTLVLRLPSGAVPAAGSCVVIPIEPLSSYRAGISEPMDAVTAHGRLNGVRGVLSHDVRATALEGWTFTRDAEGGSAPISVGGRGNFTADPPPVSQGAVHVLWTGRNNPGDDVVRDTAAMIAQITEVDPAARILVLAITNGGNEPSGSPEHALIADTNEALARVYGERFVDVRRLLIDHARRAVTEHTSAGNLADLEADIPPRSLRIDAVHFADEGYRIIADLVIDRIVELGWTVAPQSA